MPPFKGNPLTQGHKILSRYTRVLVATHKEVGYNSISARDIYAMASKFETKAL